MRHAHSHARAIATHKELINYLIVLVIGVSEIFLEIGIGFLLYDNAINAAGGIHTSGDLVIIVLSALTAGAIVSMSNQRPFVEWALRSLMGLLAVCIFLFGGITILSISIERMLTPIEGTAWVAFVIGLLSIITNYCKHKILQGSGGEHGNINVKSLTRHVKIDMSLGAIACIGGLLRMVGTFFPSWECVILRIDPGLSIIISFWLFWGAYEIANEVLTGQVMADHHDH